MSAIFSHLNDWGYYDNDIIVDLKVVNGEGNELTTLSGTTVIPTTANPYVYNLNSIRITDTAGNVRTYTHDTLPEELKTLSFEVTSDPIYPVTSVSLNRMSVSLNTNTTYQLTATITPYNATNKVITWTSSNPSTATVDSNGLVTGLSAGTTVITATSTDGTNKKATCIITVIAPLSITSQPVDVTTTSGSSFTFSVQAAGNGLSYDWKLQAGWDGLKVKCVITDANRNQIESSTATLSLPAVSITQQPVDVTATSGSSFTFSVQAAGNGLSYDWKYQWPGQSNWTSWSNGKTDTLTGTMQAGWDDWKYQWPGQSNWTSWSNGKTDTLTGTMQAGWDGLKVKCVITDVSGNHTESAVVILSLVNVQQTTEDSIAPVIVNLTFEKNIITAGEGINFTAYAQDNQSGIQSVWLYFINEDSNYGMVRNAYQSNNTGAEVSELHGYFHTFEDASPGTYSLHEIIVTDFAGNEQKYCLNFSDDANWLDIPDNLKSLSFTITNT